MPFCAFSLVFCRIRKRISKSIIVTLHAYALPHLYSMPSSPASPAALARCRTMPALQLLPDAAGAGALPALPALAPTGPPNLPLYQCVGAPLPPPHCAACATPRLAQRGAPLRRQRLASAPSPWRHPTPYQRRQPYQTPQTPEPHKNISFLPRNYRQQTAKHIQ